MVEENNWLGKRVPVKGERKWVEEKRKCETVKK